MPIPTDDTLLQEIEGFLRETEMKPSTFGLSAMNDGALVGQLRTGRRSLTLKSATRVLSFIAANRPTKSVGL